MDHIRSRLGYKIFASFFLVIVIGMGVLWITTRFTSPRAFQRHLFSMEQRMGSGYGMGQGTGQGQQSGGMMGDFYRNYQASFNESLIIAVITASVVGLAASIVLSRSITSPVRELKDASRRISEGRYSERVLIERGDELGELAASFNLMAGQLEQVEAMRRQLIGDVAHELRTPLTAIKGYAEGLMDDVLPATAETYNQIHLEAERLTKLVEDLQELSRVEAHASELNIRKVDPGQLVGTAINRIKVQYEKKRVSLTSVLPSVTVQVLADGDRTLQILSNLLSNALHYTPEGGEVQISLVAENDSVRIAVRDTGVGISAEDRSHVFDRFYRVDKSRSRNRGGSGIGLTIAKHLVEAQGGRIWAESEGENKGSVFVLTLPAAKPR